MRDSGVCVYFAFLLGVSSYAYETASNSQVSCVLRCDKGPRKLSVVVEGRHVLRIDATVAKNLALLLSDLAARDQKLIFWNWCEDARRTLISYEPSLATYCKSSGSIAQIFSGKTLLSHFVILFSFCESCYVPVHDC